jgi:hypothetical protein
LRHFMRTVLPATFSSAIWYLALQLSQRNFKFVVPVLGKSNCSSTPAGAGSFELSRAA